jgi:DNA polymerase-3 subunit epsilon
VELIVILVVAFGVYFWLRKSNSDGKGTTPVQTRVSPPTPVLPPAPDLWPTKVARASDRGELVIVDTETTGLDRHARVIELAWIVTNRHLEVLTKGSSLVRGDGHGGSPEARGVHKISDADLLRAPEFREVWDGLVDHRRGRLLVAHNARFDLKMINGELKRVGGGMVEQMACTMILARELGYADSGRPGPGFRSAKLNDLSHRLKLNVQPTHRALRDAETALELLRYFYQSHPAEAQRYLARFLP